MVKISYSFFIVFKISYSQLTLSLCVSIATCKNNGKCVNRPGSSFCACPNSNITGKRCEFDKKVCNGKCKQGETCYPKDNNDGFECLANVRNVPMVYQLDSNQIPFEDWMKYDVAQNIRNAIFSNDNNEVSLVLQR